MGILISALFALEPHRLLGANRSATGGELPTYIQGLQAVPAEGVLAVLAHHLGAALVPLNVNFALGAALDGCVVLLILVKRAAGRQRETQWV